ncbi:hypothetical protein, partial [Sansalvadorimonas verongulae]|uniref:hypothetical protein n=1 Tax=Sansalvadorimonas verongulae TaxID=2172824 RepID=UPI001E5B85A4
MLCCTRSGRKHGAFPLYGCADEMTGCGESLTAPVQVTDKGLVPCVHAFVVGEIAGCGKRLAAPVIVTGKRPFPCV